MTLSMAATEPGVSLDPDPACTCSIHTSCSHVQVIEKINKKIPSQRRTQSVQHHEGKIHRHKHRNLDLTQADGLQTFNDTHGLSTGGGTGASCQHRGPELPTFFGAVRDAVDEGGEVFHEHLRTRAVLVFSRVHHLVGFESHAR